MKITDPGDQYEYLSVEDDGHVIRILKHNRAIRFDAFWATEPVSEEDKPDMRMTRLQIPEALWKLFNEEERLTVFLAEADCEIAALKRRNKNLTGWLLAAGLAAANAVMYFVSRFFD
jgi:hypothetical protein